MKLRKSTLAAAAGLSLLGVAVTGPAFGDTNVGNTSTLAAVGSDTSQSVMEGLSNALRDSGGNPLISNYLATPVGRTITTRTGNANCTFTAPNNSGGGRDALSAALRGASYGGSTNMTGCVDVARSSSGGNPTTSPGVGKMTYVPFATDSVTYATLGATNIGHKLAKADLVSIYTANGTPGSSACIGQPLLPQAGSGTRTFFLQQLGISDVAIGATGGPGTCVKDTTATGQPIQEHDGRFLTNADQLIPFSTAQFIGQSSDVIPNQLGRAVLGAIDFSASPDANLSNAISPVQLKTSFTFNRPLFNVISTDAITSGNAAYNQKLVDTFVGSNGPGVSNNSRVCSSEPLIQQYGLALNSTCGDTSKKNTN